MTEIATPYRDPALSDKPDAPSVAPLTSLGIALRTVIVALLAFCPPIDSRPRFVASCVAAFLSIAYGARELRALRALRLTREGIVVATPWKTTWTPWSDVERIQVRWSWSGRVFVLVRSSGAPIRIAVGCYASPASVLAAFRKRIPRLFEKGNLLGAHPPLTDGSYRLNRRHGADVIAWIISIPLVAVIPAYGFHELRSTEGRVATVLLTLLVASLVVRREYHLRTRSVFTTQGLRSEGLFVGAWIPWSEVDSILESDGVRIVLMSGRRQVFVHMPDLSDLGEIEAIIRTHAPWFLRNRDWPIGFFFPRHERRRAHGED